LDDPRFSADTLSAVALAQVTPVNESQKWNLPPSSGGKISRLHREQAPLLNFGTGVFWNALPGPTTLV
jgi:hypothetical protein